MRYLYIFLAVFLFSCNEGGNYDYREINDITIEGVNDQILYSVISLKDNLKIPTQLSGRFSGKDINGLEYEWKLMPLGVNSDDSDKNYVISREKDLDHYVTENPGTYYGSYTVIDKINNAKFQKRFFVNVRSLTSEGWAVLCDENNESRLDWIFNISDDSDEILNNIWSEKNYNMGRPISLNTSYGRFGTLRLANVENGSFNLDPLLQTAGENRNMKYQFFTIPDRVDVRGCSPQIWYREPNIFVLVDNKGDIYTKSCDPGSMFDYRSNIVSGETNYFEAAPYVSMHIWKAGMGMAASIMLYDQTNCRFVEYLNESLYPSVANIRGALFKPTTNHEMIYMETTMTQNSFALLRNKSTGKYYIYGFRINSSGMNTQTFYSELKGNDLDKIGKISFHNVYNYMFYSAGSKVYRFKIQNDANNIEQAQEVISLPGETIIEIMSPKFAAWTAYKPWETDRANRLVVASNIDNQTTNCGNIRIYDVPSLSQPLVLKKEYVGKGLGKIVDIEYFERDK